MKFIQKIKIFIGSSTEALNVARKIKRGLKYNAYVDIWADGMFDKLSQSYIEVLEKAALNFDYGAFVFTLDDNFFNRKRS